MSTIESEKEHVTIHDNASVRIYGHPVTLTTDDGQEIHTRGSIVIAKAPPLMHGEQNVREHTFTVHVEVDVDVQGVSAVQGGDPTNAPSETNGDGIEKKEEE
jgi:hypothetical protein